MQRQIYRKDESLIFTMIVWSQEIATSCGRLAVLVKGRVGAER